MMRSVPTEYVPERYFAPTIFHWFWRLITFRPHEIISRRLTGPYLKRWYLLPKVRMFEHLCVYLHQFVGDDEDEALHDHPRPSVSWLFKGQYREVTPDGVKTYRAAWLWQRPTIIRRSAEMLHRIELVDAQPAWTLFIMGKKVRRWGFDCPHGWIDYEQFHDNIKQTGKGCS